jgi:hypothetical protein
LVVIILRATNSEFGLDQISDIRYSVLNLIPNLIPNLIDDEWMSDGVIRHVGDEVAVLACAASTIGRKGQVTGSISQNQLPKGICGNVECGLIYGSGYLNTDMSVLKYVPLFTGRVKLHLRGKLLHAFNRVNFNDPTTHASSSTFDRIAGAVACDSVNHQASLVTTSNLEKK